MRIFENDLIFIDIHKSPIPWLKIFPQRKIQELSMCTLEEKTAIFEALDSIEKLMLSYYKPTKINIASFGNYLPHLHFHIMARFANDSHFPEPMWGQKQREDALQLPCFTSFIQKLKTLL